MVLSDAVEQNVFILKTSCQSVDISPCTLGLEENTGALGLFCLYAKKQRHLTSAAFVFAVWIAQPLYFLNITKPYPCHIQILFFRFKKYKKSVASYLC